MHFSWVKALVTGRSRIHTITPYHFRRRTGATFTRAQFQDTPLTPDHPSAKWSSNSIEMSKDAIGNDQTGSRVMQTAQLAPSSGESRTLNQEH
jgi:hypothetical protein